MINSWTRGRSPELLRRFGDRGRLAVRLADKKLQHLASSWSGIAVDARQNKPLRYLRALIVVNFGESTSSARLTTLLKQQTEFVALHYRSRYCAGVWPTVVEPWLITPQAIRLPALPAGSVM
jgi:hypothetical protein